ncbi:MAG: PD-(D/E)XK nuclease family protein [Acidobacteriota bacterium]
MPLSAKELRDGLGRIQDRMDGLECAGHAGDFRRRVEGLGRRVEKARRQGKWIKTHFNVFDVLGRPRLELAHSGVLAWLLDPEEAHGLGDAFLRGFLRRVAPGSRFRTGSVRVQRERRIAEGFLDINVQGPDWRLVVENKIDCPEGEDQTEKYWRCLNKYGRRTRIVAVFLTPDGRKPQCPRFRPLSWRKLESLLCDLNVRGDAAVVIRHFAEHTCTL